MATTKKFTVVHRLLHWVMALAMMVLFITGFLRMFWMNKNHIVGIISAKTQESPLPKEVMSDIAKSIRAPMWEWHELFAHIMIIALIIRIVYMIAKGIRFTNPFQKGISAKEKMQGFTYIYFYVFVLISAFTGICIEKELLTQWEDTIEQVHKFGLYWFPLFVLLHLAGIIIAEHGKQKGIVSKMIGGD